MERFFIGNFKSILFDVVVAVVVADNCPILLQDKSICLLFFLSRFLFFLMDFYLGVLVKLLAYTQKTISKY